MTELSPAEQIFFAALAVDSPEARADYLKRECPDRELRARVERMLAAHTKVGDFLEHPPISFPCEAERGAGRDRGWEAGAILSRRYVLDRRIGAGGMGEVWAVTQIEPVRRKVAIKLIRAGMGTSSVLSRFEAERQALAMMDHPNIARVLDAGAADDGRPFFVMELVDGIPITKFCDERRLTPRERLELFVPVCQAIQHAHQKGIIHRDIKPSNILVALYDDRPVPKVIDFGVAKAIEQPLSERAVETGIGAMIGTPQYMSPEQATFDNLDIDTRSDIYSLGVLLYELLAGSPPFSETDLNKAGLLEMLRVVREESPPRPSGKLSTADSLPTLAANRNLEPRKLSGLLRDELDWVVMMALEKERSRRYPTANAFAADVQRYLAGEPVQAHPPTVGYRLRKFIRRRRGPVFAVTLVFLALVAGIVGTSIGMMRAEKSKVDADHAWQAESERADAERLAKLRALEEQARAEKAEDETLAAYRASTDDAIEQLIGSKPELGPQERYLRKSLARWQEFANRTGNDRRSKAISAEGHYRVALLWSKLGQDPKAHAECERARNLYYSLVEEFPGVPDNQKKLADAHLLLGNLLKKLGRRDEAQREFEQSRLLYSQLVDAFPNTPDYISNLVNSHKEIGYWLRNGGQRDEARNAFEQALKLHKCWIGISGDAVDPRKRALFFSDTGFLLDLLEQREAAIVEYSRSRDILRNLADAHPDEFDHQNFLVGIHINLGNHLAEIGQQDAARIEFEQARDRSRKLVAAFPNVPRHQQNLAASQSVLGNLLAALGKSDAARKEYEQAIEGYRRLAGAFKDSAEYQDGLAMDQYNLGNLLLGLREYEAARKEYEKSRDRLRMLADQFPKEPRYLRQLASCQMNLGAVLEELGKTAAACTEYEQSRDRFRTLTEAHPKERKYQEGLAGAQFNLGQLLAGTGQNEAAYKEFERARDRYRQIVQKFPNETVYAYKFAGAQNSLGVVLLDLGRVDAALRELEQAREGCRRLIKSFPDRSEYQQLMALIQSHLGDAYLRAGRQDLAFTAHLEARDLYKKFADAIPPITDHKVELASLHNKVGMQYLARGQLDAARKEFEQARDRFGQLVEAFPKNPAYRNDVAMIHANLGTLLDGLGQREAARKEFRSACEQSRKLVEFFPKETNYRNLFVMSHGIFGRFLRKENAPADSLLLFGEAIKVMNSLAESEPRNIQIAAALSEFHLGRALALDQLGRHAEADTDWSRSLELIPRPYLMTLRFQRADSRVRTGKAIEGLAEAAELSKTMPATAEWRYNFACFYAVASSKIAVKKLEYADRAMELLREAVKLGFVDGAHMAKDPDLDSLRNRDDFKKLLASLPQPKKSLPSPKKQRLPRTLAPPPREIPNNP